MTEPTLSDLPPAKRPWYRRKLVIIPAAGLGLLILIGIVGGNSDKPAPTVPVAAPTLDATGQQLLADLAYVGIVSTDPANMVELGHKVCAAFDVGGSYWQIMASLTAGRYTTEQASKVIAVSAADMCPLHTPAVDAALTPALSTPVPVQVAVAPPAPPNTFTDGEYIVGEDMPAGTYVTPGNTSGGSCYWARHKNVQGTAGDIILGGNHLGSGKTSVLAKPGEVVELSLGCTYTKK